MGQAVPIVGGVIGAYGMTQMLKGNVRTRNTKSVGTKVVGGAASGAAIGGAIGSFWGPVGTGIGYVIGGVIGAVVGLVRGLWKSGKHKDQYERDAVQSAFRDTGISDFNARGETVLKLSDGSTFEPNLEDDTKGWTTIGNRNAAVYEASDEELRNPMFAHVKGALDPLTMGYNEGRADQFATYMSSAAMTTLSPENEVIHWYKQYFKALGAENVESMTHSDIIDWIGGNYEDLNMTLEEAQMAQNSLNYLFDPEYDRATADEAYAIHVEDVLDDHENYVAPVGLERQIVDEDEGDI